VIDGKSGTWLQNVLDVGGSTPSSIATTDRIFTAVTVPASPIGTDSTACAKLGIAPFTGCIAVFAHESQHKYWDWNQ
jgi:hypothetical protein